jgi:deoxycytidylate deaminase
MPSKRQEIIATTYDKRGRVISTAKNSYSKTHTLQAQYASRVGADDKIYLHAEILAIIRAKGKEIHKIKIERYDSNGNPRLSRPCSVCDFAIAQAKIKVIEYTLNSV